MDMSAALDLGREALLTALIVSGPILAAGLLVGLIISLVQTVTQLHDQTLSIVPKIVAMLAAAVFFVPWLANRIIEYTQQLLGNM
jgi:flagellar biosynthesis protein FliQ